MDPIIRQGFPFITILILFFNNLKVGSYLELLNEELLNQWNKSDLGISIYELFTLISNRVIRKYV